jgi:hypothetical protein
MYRFEGKKLSLQCSDDLQFKCIFHCQSKSGTGSEIKVIAGSGKILISDPQHWSLGFRQTTFHGPECHVQVHFHIRRTVVPSWNYSDSSESKPGFNLNCPAEQYRYILSIYSCSYLIVQFREGRVLYESSNVLSAINMTLC